MKYDLDISLFKQYNIVSKLVEYVNTPEDFRNLLGVWGRGVRSGYYDINLASLKTLGHIIHGYQYLFNNSVDDPEFGKAFEEMSAYFWDSMTDEEFRDKDFYDNFRDAVYACTFRDGIDHRWFRGTNVYEEVSEGVVQHCFNSGSSDDLKQDPFFDIAVEIWYLKSDEDKKKSRRFGEFIVKEIHERLKMELEE